MVSPLLALISDQLEAMERYGIPAARIDSTLDHGETVKIREKVVKGEIKVLMVSVRDLRMKILGIFCPVSASPCLWWTKPTVSPSGDIISDPTT